jgi:hypothetical protein
MSAFEGRVLPYVRLLCSRNRKSSPERGGAPTGRRGPTFVTDGAGVKLGSLRRFAPPPRSGEDLKCPLSTRGNSLTNVQNLSETLYSPPSISAHSIPHRPNRGHLRGQPPPIVGLCNRGPDGFDLFDVHRAGGFAVPVGVSEGA